MARKKSSFYDFYFTPSQPIEVDDGIKARSQRGAFVKNWWATRWIRTLEHLMDSGRLTRGRRYARKGQVRSLEESKSGILARVQGSRATPYKVTLQLSHLSDSQWENVIDGLAEQALFTAELLAGEMPQDIEQAFYSAGVSLFPDKPGDLQTACSCPDWSNPCKHIAATHYILGERFDEDPFLLFRLRGRTQEQILQSLRQRRGGQVSPGEEEEEEPEIVVPLAESLDRFYELGASLAGFSIAIREPTIEMPLLKRLDNAAFVPDPGIRSMLRSAFQEITRSALGAAFQEQYGEENGP